MKKALKEALATIGILAACAGFGIAYVVLMHDRHEALVAAIEKWLTVGLLCLFGLAVLGIFVRLFAAVFGTGISYGLGLDKLFKRNPYL
jgi:hypothetical protein